MMMHQEGGGRAFGDGLPLVADTGAATASVDVMQKAPLLAVVLIGALVGGCATTSASSTTWTAAPAPGAWSRHGRVEWIRENVQREDGHPAAGAAAGAVIGALIGGRGPGALFGAVGGAAVGAAASQGHSERRRYDVMVRFNDGYAQMFFYDGYAPFRPGESVTLTPQGLFHG